MNDYDKAARFLIKRDPAGFFHWLFGAPVAFHAWIDARRTALPDQGDLTGDLVAAFRVSEAFEAVCIEIQSESRPDTAERLLLGYMPRLASEAGGPTALPLASVGGAVMNLTGPPQPSAVRWAPTVSAACRLEGSVLQRTLRDEDAADLLSAVTAETASRWLLAVLPLMRGGDDEGIIDGWRREAIRLTDARDRATLGSLTLLFAALGGRRLEWQSGLRGWEMETSPFLDEYRAQGRFQALRETVLHLGRQRFGRSPTRKQRAELEATTDLARLERIRDRLLAAASWADLLSTP
jgi:hypothetical protein